MAAASTTSWATAFSRPSRDGPPATYAADASGSVSNGLRINGAVAAGPVLFGVAGTGDHPEYPMIGEAVHRSTELEPANKVVRSSAICDVSTFDLACAQDCRPKPGQTAVSGIDVPEVERSVDRVALARLRLGPSLLHSQALSILRSLDMSRRPATAAC